MTSFRCYDDFDVNITLLIINFYTVVIVFPYPCERRQSSWSNLEGIGPENQIEPPKGPVHGKHSKAYQSEFLLCS